MKLYYTGAKTFGASQTLPANSIGGFMSIDVVPNARIDAVFDAPTITDIKENRFDIIGLILKNETGLDITGLKFYFEQLNANTYFNYEIAFTGVLITGNEKSIEKVADNHSLPYIGEFNSAYSLEDALVVGNFENNAYLGIWIKRIIDETKYKDYNSDQAIIDRFLANEPTDLREEVTLKILFD